MNRFERTLLWCLLLVFFVAVDDGTAASKTKGNEKAGEESIVVKADTLEWNNAQERVVFSGQVNAEMDEFMVDCKKMTVFYKNLSEGKNIGEGETEIQKIVALGGVKITRTQGGTATADQAVYYQKDEKLVLTGNPVVKQGKDFVEGQIITIFLKENRSVVEGSGEKKVKAIIFPGRQKP